MASSYSSDSSTSTTSTTSGSSNNIEDNNDGSNFVVVRPKVVPDVPDDLICTICLNLPIEPILLQPCGHIFCSYCIHKSFIRNGQQCPLDRIKCATEDIQPLAENAFAYRSWCSIQVQCSKSMNGCSCTWSGSIFDYAKSHQFKCRLDGSLIKNRREKRAENIAELVNENNQLKENVEDLTKYIQEIMHIQTRDKQNDTATLRPDSGVFDSTYSYDRTNIVELNLLLATYLHDKPGVVKRLEIFKCIKARYFDYRKNRVGNKLDIQMLLATANASTWFRSNQSERLEIWLRDLE